MSNLIAVDFTKIEGVLIHGDLSKLSTPEKVNYYNKVCTSLGLNPLTKPFDYIRLNGKEVLYAKRDATDQLRRIYGVSIVEVKKETAQDIMMVTARAVDKSGREDTAMGAVNIKGLSGESLANALMKAETKAKRRVTLSICGLGLLDETEIDTAGAAQERNVQAQALTAAVQKTDDKPEFEAADYFMGPPEEPAADDLGEYVVTVGKKFKGKKLKDISPKDLSAFVDWVNSKDDVHADVKAAAGKMQEYLEVSK